MIRQVIISLPARFWRLLKCLGRFCYGSGFTLLPVQLVVRSKCIHARWGPIRREWAPTRLECLPIRRNSWEFGKATFYEVAGILSTMPLSVNQTLEVTIWLKGFYVLSFWAECICTCLRCKFSVFLSICGLKGSSHCHPNSLMEKLICCTEREFVLSVANNIFIHWSALSSTWCGRL